MKALNEYKNGSCMVKFERSYLAFLERFWWVDTRGKVKYRAVCDRLPGRYFGVKRTFLHSLIKFLEKLGTQVDPCVSPTQGRSRATCRSAGGMCVWETSSRCDVTRSSQQTFSSSFLRTPVGSAIWKPPTWTERQTSSKGVW